MPPKKSVPVSQGPRRTVGSIDLPVRAPVAAVEAGVTATLRPERAGASDGKRRMSAFEAAESCSLFPGGGSAFARWAQSTQRKTMEEWLPLLQDFAGRPIHGHRRSA